MKFFLIFCFVLQSYNKYTLQNRICKGKKNKKHKNLLNLLLFKFFYNDKFCFINALYMYVLI